MKKNLYLYIFACVLGASLLGGPHANAQGEEAPAFRLLSLDGNIHTEGNFIGKPTLLIFWNSWCHLCPSELPKVCALQERMKGTKFQVLAIGFADTEANIRDYVTSHPTHFTFPVLYDFGDRVARDYGVNRTPTFFLLNDKGELELAYKGEGLFEHPQFQTKLSELIDQDRWGRQHRKDEANLGVALNPVSTQPGHMGRTRQKVPSNSKAFVFRFVPFNYVAGTPLLGG